MTARISEKTVKSFRVRPEALLDLDAIVRQRSHEINPNADIEYNVERKDNYSFSTGDIEQILSERNGRETAIVSLTLAVKRSDELQLRVIFGDGITIWGYAEDRARFLLLVADVRTVIRERMAGRASRLVPNHWRVIIPLLAAVIVMVGLITLASTLLDTQSAQYDQKNSRLQ